MSLAQGRLAILVRLRVTADVTARDGHLSHDLKVLALTLTFICYFLFYSCTPFVLLPLPYRPDTRRLTRTRTCRYISYHLACRRYPWELGLCGAGERSAESRGNGTSKSRLHPHSTEAHPAQRSPWKVEYLAILYLPFFPSAVSGLASTDHCTRRASAMSESHGAHTRTIF